MTTMQKQKCLFALFAAFFVTFAGCRGAQLSGPSEAPFGSKSQPRFKPGFNLFSVEQDVQMGRQSAEQVLREERIIEDPRLVNYVRQLGAKLASKAAGERFNYQFWVVGTKEINAFALPGGYLFVNAGTIAAAKNEGELAGVMAHEIAHSALRHGTNQASKARLAEGGLGILGAIAGSGDQPALGQVINQIGGMGANMLFLKFGRKAEKEADLEGARIIAEAGYDPRDMANFFKTLQAQGGQRTPEIMSDHPDPGNRIKYINEEIPKLPVGANPQHDSQDFQNARALLTGGAPQVALNAKNQMQRRGPSDPGDMQPGQRPPLPSRQMRGFQAKDGSFAVQVPANWDGLDGGPSTLIFAPKGAYGQYQGQFIVTHGIFIGVADAASGDLGQATAALIQRQIEDNPDFQLVQQPKPIDFGGQRGYATAIAGPSANTGVMEVDVTYTTATRDGKLFYIVTICPEDEQNAYKAAFQQIMQSLRLGR
jgi:Zn-dependent protease with chaperone function